MAHSTPSPYGNDDEIADVLFGTRAMLRTVEVALDSFPATPNREQAVAQMRNVVVFGRAVTNVVQNLRSKVQDFDDWYQPWVKEMRKDPLLKYLYELRSAILKEGREGVTVTMTFQSTSSGELLRMLQPAPPNAVSAFLGDKNGGSGWVVQLEDGSTEKMYIALPENNDVRVRLAFENLPSEHLGTPITENSLENICRLYVQYLRRLVEAAEERFGSSASALSDPSGP